MLDRRVARVECVDRRVSISLSNTEQYDASIRQTYIRKALLVSWMVKNKSRVETPSSKYPDVLERLSIAS